MKKARMGLRATQVPCGRSPIHRALIRPEWIDMSVESVNTILDRMANE
jgi:hypothetical protein